MFRPSLALLLTACAAHNKTATIGVTSSSEVSNTEEEDSPEGAEVGTQEMDARGMSDGELAHNGTEDISPDVMADEAQWDETSAEESGQASRPEMDAELLRADAAQQELATEALDRSKRNENPWGLSLAVSERASDLPWILALRNDSKRPVRLARLPSLVRFDVRKQGSEEAVTCGGKDVPKRLDSDDQTDLGPGELLYYPFDPRTLCEEADTLSEGSEVTLTYGFETQTKKLWRGGKLVEVETEQTQPFVAELVPGGEKEAVAKEGADAQEETPGIKYLVSETFVLGPTYPLRSVSLEDAGVPALPPPPLKVSVSDLGTHQKPEMANIVVTVKNVSDRSMHLFLRRELITYEVVGEWSSATCSIHPDARAPDPAAFAHLSPGESRTLSTRLMEACPPDTWKYPGKYSISARLTANASGSEHGLSAFVGVITSERPARLEVPGRTKRPAMRVVR